MQNDLFDVGADLSTPVVAEPEFPPLRVRQDVRGPARGLVRHYNEPLPKLRSFVLPGGTAGAALLHVATHRDPSGRALHLGRAGRPRRAP